MKYLLIPQKLWLKFHIFIRYYEDFSLMSTGSKLIMNNDPTDGLRTDLFYYESNEQKNESGDFEILSYDLDFDITDKLNAKAIISVSKDLPEYKFTLYHGYKVNSISNQDGVPLKFTQEGDYFIVRNNTNVSKLSIEYSGYSPKFYSNSQGMVLPGFFAYYPHNGFKFLYNTEEQAFDKVLLKKEAEFEISVSGVKRVYSSLSESRDGNFSGKSRGVTIVSGFIESRLSHGIEVVYPYMDTTEFSFDAIDKSINEFVSDYHNSSKIKKIIILPNLNLGNMNTVTYDEYVTARNFDSLSENCAYADINPRKRYLYQLIGTYLNDAEYFNQMLEYEKKSNVDSNSKLSVIINGKIDKLGIDRFLDMSSAYIEDDSDIRTVAEFLNGLS